MSDTRLVRLLPGACLLAAVVLFASQLMTMFEFTPSGGEPLESRSVIDHHGPALLVIAAFAALATILTALTGSKPAATAVGVMGGLALLIFLIIDLPDAGQVGSLNTFFEAEAVPQGGFFLEMIGALGLAVTGVALATMGPEQLAALRPGGPTEREDGEGQAARVAQAERRSERGRAHVSETGGREARDAPVRRRR